MRSHFYAIACLILLACDDSSTGRGAPDVAPEAGPVDMGPGPGEVFVPPTADRDRDGV